MPVSEERKQQMKAYRSTRKEQQRFYFEQYLANLRSIPSLLTNEKSNTTNKRRCVKVLYNYNHLYKHLNKTKHLQILKNTNKLKNTNEEDVIN
jgi:hypothetical protein